MRFAPLFVAILLVATFAYAENQLTPTNAWDGVKATAHPGGPGFGFTGGEDIGTCAPIAGLPFTGAGNTCNAIHNYDEVCPYGPHTSQDVVYCFTPTQTVEVTLSLCNSYFDTKMFIYKDTYTPGLPYACNDDYCSGPNYPYSYLSYLECVLMEAGHTYYIVIAGYSTSCGDYILDMYECVPCDVVCDPSAIPEGEPVCGPNYVDNYNGGCNSTPYVFQTVECPCNPVIYCGESGGFLYGYSNYRDTDWYEITLDATTTITATVEAEFDVLMFLLDGNASPGPDPCLDADIIITYSTQFECVPLTLSHTFAPGTYWIWVGPSGFGPDAATCGDEYELIIDGYCPGTGTESSTWGEVKQIFR